MTTNIRTIDGFQSFSIGDFGQSDTARDLERIKLSGQFTTSSKDLMKREVVRNLIDAIQLAASDNWDGYLAHPTDPGSLLYSVLFINNLPPELSLPEIAVDHDGEIAFEWDYGPRKIISIRVSRDGSLHYAGLVGFSSFHGVETLRASIPNQILTGIRRVIESHKNC